MVVVVGVVVGNGSSSGSSYSSGTSEGSTEREEKMERRNGFSSIICPYYPSLSPVSYLIPTV